MAIVGILDSGVGGLSVYREIKRLLPDCSYVYFADSAFCPYGTRSRDEIIGRVRHISALLRDKGADAIVIACNTATAAAISVLRSENPDFPFVGMEPAVKPAAIATSTGTIGVLATAGTLNASKYLDTKDNYCQGVKILEHVGEGFVELVENGDLNSAKADATVRASLLPLLDGGADKIVLGCTHYPFLLNAMKRAAAGKNVEFIDPAPAVARQLKRVLEEKGISLIQEHPSIELLSSGNAAVLTKLAQNLEI